MQRKTARLSEPLVSVTLTSHLGRGFAIAARVSGLDSDLAARVFDLDFDSAGRLGSDYLASLEPPC
jgi:hypothetical protein